MQSETPVYSRPFTAAHTFTHSIEGPACDRLGNLYAVNFARSGTIGRVSPAGVATCWLTLPTGHIGNGIVAGRHGELYVADYVGHTILRIDTNSRAITVFAHEPTMHQPNDLAIAADGTLYASDPDWIHGGGQLWQIDGTGRATLLERDMGTTNGIEMSPDERTLYVNETLQRTIWAYDRGPSGSLSNKRLLIRFPDYGLDGMRCDSAGHLYVTRYGKGVVAQIDAGGKVLREIVVGGQLCTNLAFGGPDGRTCYVTIADTGAIEWFRVDAPGRSWCLWREE